MTALIVAALLGPVPLIHSPYVGQEWLSTGGGTMVGTLTMKDDTPICLGDTTCDWWLVYNSSGTQFEIWHTSCDGGGTDCEVLICGDGTDDCTLAGSFTATGGVNLNADNIKLTWGAAGATDSYGQFTGTNLQFYSSGNITMLAPLSVGVLEIDEDTGAVMIINQESVAAADGTELSVCIGADSDCIFKVYAEADGSGGIDEMGIDLHGFDGMEEKRRYKTTILDFDTGAASVTWTGALPVGAYQVAVTGRIIEADTGACTSLDVGDASDGDLYADDLDETSTTETFGSADYTATLNYNVDKTSGASNIVANAIGGNCVDLRLYLEIAYYVSTGPTSAP